MAMPKKKKDTNKKDRRQFDDTEFVKNTAKRKKPEVKEKPKYNTPKQWLSEADDDELE
jgi:hypothetical protein